MNKRSFSRIPEYSQYIPRVPRIIFLIKNFYTYILAWLGFTQKSEQTFNLRNGFKITTGEPIDACTINGVFVVDIYRSAFGRSKEINEMPVIIDIGANIGVFAVYAIMKRPKAFVYCYEPFKKNYDVLLKNIIQNSLSGSIKAFNLGVTSKKETRRLYLDDSVSHSIYKREYLPQETPKSVDINCISLQDVFSENKLDYCDILKIDTEGSEYEIIFNAPDGILRKIHTIIMECHHASENESYNSDGMKEFLNKHGFSVEKQGRNMIYAVNKEFAA